MPRPCGVTTWPLITETRLRHRNEVSNCTCHPAAAAPPDSSWTLTKLRHSIGKRVVITLIIINFFFCQNPGDFACGRRAAVGLLGALRTRGATLRKVGGAATPAQDRLLGSLPSFSQSLNGDREQPQQHQQQRGADPRSQSSRVAARAVKKTIETFPRAAPVGRSGRAAAKLPREPCPVSIARDGLKALARARRTPPGPTDRAGRGITHGTQVGNKEIKKARAAVPSSQEAGKARSPMTPPLRATESAVLLEPT